LDNVMTFGNAGLAMLHDLQRTHGMVQGPSAQLQAHAEEMLERLMAQRLHPPAPPPPSQTLLQNEELARWALEKLSHRTRAKLMRRGEQGMQALRSLFETNRLCSAHEIEALAEGFLGLMEEWDEEDSAEELSHTSVPAAPSLATTPTTANSALPRAKPPPPMPPFGSQVFKPFCTLCGLSLSPVPSSAGWLKADCTSGFTAMFPAVLGDGVFDHRGLFPLLLPLFPASGGGSVPLGRFPSFLFCSVGVYMMVPFNRF